MMTVPSTDAVAETTVNRDWMSIYSRYKVFPAVTVYVNTTWLAVTAVVVSCPVFSTADFPVDVPKDTDPAPVVNGVSLVTDTFWVAGKLFTFVCTLPEASIAASWVSTVPS